MSAAAIARPSPQTTAASCKIAGVLFDMDGVLIDARDWHYEAFNAALHHFGLSIGRDEHLAHYDGLPTRTKLELLTAARGLPRKLHGFINALKQDYTAALAYERCRPVFHHQYALSRLKREGFKIAVCSNSVRRSVELMMELSRLGPNLDLMLSSDDVPSPKPSPDIYQMAMARLGLEPDQCLIVEDNAHGVAAARASGAAVLAVAGVEDVTYARLAAAIAELEAAA